MDKFLVKRPLSSPVASQARKKAKQGALSANQRAKQYPADIFYVDDKTA